MNIFTGVLINAGLIVAGSITGLMLKKIKDVDRICKSIFSAFGIFVAVMGIQGADLSEPLFFIICLLIGTIIGECLDIDGAFNRLGAFIQKKTSPKNSREDFSRGFTESSLMFCIGSMTFLGAIESATTGKHTIYITKGIIDGVSSITFAVNYGISTAFSAFSVIIYQGLLTAGANILAPVLTSETINMCAAVGSLSLIAIGTNMLGITKIKAANMLPAMFLPMIWQAILLLFR